MAEMQAANAETKEARADQLANTVDMACARLCLSRVTLYALLKAGDIRAIKVGTRTLIPETELVGLIQRKLEAA